MVKTILAALGRMYRWTALAGVLVLNGCAIRSKGTVHHIIIGFGIVSVKQTNGIEVSKAQALGLAIYAKEGFRLSAGYSCNIFTSIPDGTTNLLLEVSQKPFAPLTIKAP
jgi:hypothetical protein